MIIKVPLDAEVIRKQTSELFSQSDNHRRHSSAVINSRYSATSANASGTGAPCLSGHSAPSKPQ